MLRASFGVKIYLGLGITDMRKSINGLSIIVERHLDFDPFSGHFFVFCNRRRTILKILYWDRNGFCVWQKRLEKDYFKWPKTIGDTLMIDERELMWLMDGLEMHQKDAHKRLLYSTLY
jgi:transposase